MWDEMVDDYDTDVHGVNKEESFLVGDAAGRDGDFSASDRYRLILLKFLPTLTTITNSLYWVIIKILRIQCWDQIPYTGGILSGTSANTCERFIQSHRGGSSDCFCICNIYQ